MLKYLTKLQMGRFLFPRPTVYRSGNPTDVCQATVCVLSLCFTFGVPSDIIEVLKQLVAPREFLQ